MPYKPVLTILILIFKMLGCVVKRLIWEIPVYIILSYDSGKSYEKSIAFGQ